jgi:hypothetical protein
MLVNSCLKYSRNGRWALVLLGYFFAAAAFALSQAADQAGQLRTKYQSLAAQLKENQFNQPLLLESTDTSNGSSGDIWAITDHPYTSFESTFSNPDNWCDVLILHLNTKYCRSNTGSGGPVLAISIGGKSPEPLNKNSLMQFAFHLSAAAPDYFEGQLTADSGPYSTSNYRIRLQAIPVGGVRTFLHLTYAYEYGTAGRLAMHAYLATVGRSKVGFTIVGNAADGTPQYIGGVRGIVERNTMRYFLAIDSYLDALAAPREQQLERRLETWFDASERYARQLHEVDRVGYLDMKRDEVRRQQAVN